MKKFAFITLSQEGLKLGVRLQEAFSDLDLFAHIGVETDKATHFERVIDLTPDIFPQYEGLIYAMPCGVVVRAIAPCVQHKLSDPAVVVLDVFARHVVSLLSGHEGGANDLTLLVSNALDAEPVISTTTEAVKDLIVGVGCRRGMPSDAIEHAICTALEQADVTADRVRFLATADIKADETGLVKAATTLGIPLRIISSDDIRTCAKEFTQSDFVHEKVQLPAVAEPAALLAGRRTELLLPKTAFNGITVAIAKERSMW